jgi:hypothetical protein
MNDPQRVRTPVHRLLGDGRPTRHPAEADSLPSSEFEALRSRPIDMRPSIQDARDAARRQPRG